MIKQKRLTVRQPHQLAVRQLTLDDAARFALRNTRTADHLTSIAAARNVYKRASRHRELALQTHHEHPAGINDFELAQLTGISQTSIGKRRLELVREGLIEKTEMTRAAPSGSPSIVWKITEKGIERACQKK